MSVLCVSDIFISQKRGKKSRLCFVQTRDRGWDEVVNDRFTIELQLFCSTLAVAFTLLVVLFNWFHAPFIITL